MKYNQIPTQAQNLNGYNADFADVNSYFLNKNTHHIQVPPNAYKVSPVDASISTLYISFIIQENSLFQYSINVLQSMIPLCPNINNQCSNQNGACNQGKCTCNQGWIDEDCSISAGVLSKDIQWNSNSITNNVWTYAYFVMPMNQDYRGSDMQIIIKKGAGTVFFYTTIQGTTQSQCPNALDYSSRDVVTDTSQTFVIQNSQLIDPFGYPRKIIFGMLSGDSNSQSVSLLINQYSQPTSSSAIDTNIMIVYFLLGVAGALFLVWIVLTIYRIKQQRLQEQQQLVQQQQQSRRRSGHTLSPQLIELCMPLLNYEIAIKDINERHQVVLLQSSPGKNKINIADNSKTIELQQDQDACCSVCLVEFVNIDKVRNTICLHTFHFNCLEEWLKKHENCPLCRSGLAKKDLEQWAQKNADDMDDDDDEDDDEEGEGEGEEEEIQSEEQQNENQQESQQQSQNQNPRASQQHQNNNNNQIQQIDQLQQEINDIIQIRSDSRGRNRNQVRQLEPQSVQIHDNQSQVRILQPVDPVNMFNDIEQNFNQQPPSQRASQPRRNNNMNL